MLVVHMSNYLAVDEGTVDEIVADVTPPMPDDEARVMLERTWVAMEAHPDAEVVEYNNHGQPGAHLTYLDHEGIRWHVWLDTTDTGR